MSVVHLLAACSGTSSARFEIDIDRLSVPEQAMLVPELTALNEKMPVPELALLVPELEVGLRQFWNWHCLFRNKQRANEQLT